MYQLINPIVKTVLKSPIHSALSNNTLLMSFAGRKSGKSYEVPISYARDSDQFLCFTAQENQWWRNLRGDVDVQLLVAGICINATTRLEMADHTAMANDLAIFLTQVPRDAKHSGVRLDKRGIPCVSDLSNAAKNLVSIHFTVIARTNQSGI